MANETSIPNSTNKECKCGNALCATMQKAALKEAIEDLKGHSNFWNECQPIVDSVAEVLANSTCPAALYLVERAKWVSNTICCSTTSYHGHSAAIKMLCEELQAFIDG